MKNAETTWKHQKKGAWDKGTQQFFDFVSIMDDHSYLFKFIPTGDKYVSLIAGVVTTVVKVKRPLQASDWNSFLTLPARV